MGFPSETPTFVGTPVFLQKCEALEAQLLAAAGKVAESQSTAAAAAQDEGERLRKKLKEVTQASVDKDQVCCSSMLSRLCKIDEGQLQHYRAGLLHAFYRRLFDPSL